MIGGHLLSFPERNSDLITGKVDIIVNRSVVEGAGSEHPPGFCPTLGHFIPGGPERMSGLAVVSKDGDFDHGSLVGLLGQRNFRNLRGVDRSAVVIGKRNGRHAVKKVVPVRPDGSRANFENEIALLDLVAQPGSACGHVLPECRTQVLKIDGAADGLGVEINLFPAKDSEIDFFDGPVDGVADEKLLGPGPPRVAPACRTATAKRTAEQDEACEQKPEKGVSGRRHQRMENEKR